jgi:hypothetical protein
MNKRHFGFIGLSALALASMCTSAHAVLYFGGTPALGYYSDPDMSHTIPQPNISIPRLGIVIENVSAPDPIDPPVPDPIDPPIEIPLPVAPAVPEPSTWTMIILGFAGIGFMAYRRRWCTTPP